MCGERTLIIVIIILIVEITGSVPVLLEQNMETSIAGEE